MKGSHQKLRIYIPHLILLLISHKKGTMDNEIDGIHDESTAKLIALKKALVCVLCSNGILGKVKAQLRASAVSCLRGNPALADAAVGKTIDMNRVPIASQIVLVLIHQFLIAHDMNITAGVFEAEGSLDQIDAEAIGIAEAQFLSNPELSRNSTLAFSASKQDESPPHPGVDTPRRESEEETVSCLGLLVKDALKRWKEPMEKERESVSDRSDYGPAGHQYKRRSCSSSSSTSPVELHCPNSSKESFFETGNERSDQEQNSLLANDHLPTASTESTLLNLDKGVADGSSAPRADPEHERQLRELGDDPAVGQAVRDLEDSFIFLDADGGLTKDEIATFDTVQDWK